MKKVQSYLESLDSTKTIDSAKDINNLDSVVVNVLDSEPTSKTLSKKELALLTLAKKYGSSLKSTSLFSKFSSVEQVLANEEFSKEFNKLNKQNKEDLKKYFDDCVKYKKASIFDDAYGDPVNPSFHGYLFNKDTIEEEFNLKNKNNTPEMF